MTLNNPAKMPVQRYAFRGAQISTPYNVDQVDAAGARFRATTHDDVAFVGRVSELVSASSRHVESRMLGNGHVRCGGRGWEDRRLRGAGRPASDPTSAPRSSLGLLDLSVGQPPPPTASTQI